MKKIVNYLSIAVLGLSLTTATSCKKNEDKLVCHITNIVAGTPTNPSVIGLTYDNDGRLSKVVESGTSGETRVFSYGTNMITITTSRTSTGALTGTNTLTLNADGNITLMIERDPGGNLVSKNTYVYNSAGKLQTETYEYASFPADVTNYQFINGDLVQSINGTDVANYTYYTDKSFQDGDFWKTLQYIYTGSYTVVNDHLMKSYSSGSDVTTNVYQFDGDGKITKCVQSVGSTVENTIDYTYTCK